MSAARAALSGLLISGSYVVLWTVISVLTRLRAVRHASTFTVFFAVACCEVLKIGLVLAGWCVWTWRNDRRRADGHPSAPAATDRVWILVGRELLQYMHFWPKALSLAVIFAGVNVLTYWNLQHIPADLYRLLFNMKVFFSALFSAALLGKRLSVQQWVALVLLLAGCTLATYSGQLLYTQPLGVLLVLMQGALSSFGGAWSERMLKGDRVPFAVQCAYQYVGGALLNACLGSAQQLWTAGRVQPLLHFDALVWAVVVSTALGGLTTAFLLQRLSNMLKEFAHGSVVLLTIAASHRVLGTPLTPGLLAGAALVLAATVLYAQPVPSAPGLAWLGRVRTPSSAPDA